MLVIKQFKYLIHRYTFIVVTTRNLHHNLRLLRNAYSKHTLNTFCFVLFCFYLTRFISVVIEIFKNLSTWISSWMVMFYDGINGEINFSLVHSECKIYEISSNIYYVRMPYKYPNIFSYWKYEYLQLTSIYFMEQLWTVFYFFTV